MYRGINAVVIDAKSRMVMPVRYRERLQSVSQSQLVITIDPEERCLLIYSKQDWEMIESKLATLPSFNSAARRIQRLLMGHATDVDMDAQGRVLLPGLLKSYAGLEKSAMLVGQGKKFELWDESHWEKSRAQWLAEEMDAQNDLLPEEVKSIAL